MALRKRVGETLKQRNVDIELMIFLFESIQDFILREVLLELKDNISISLNLFDYDRHLNVLDNLGSTCLSKLFPLFEGAP